jgi:hypothetical protein
MKTNNIAKLTIFLALISFLACSKNDEVVLNKSVETMQTETKNETIDPKSIISFSSKEDFRELYAFLFENQDREEFLVNYIKQNYSIQSVREIYKNGMKLFGTDEFNKYVSKYPKVFFKENTGDSEIYSFAGSNLMSYLLNSEAMLIVNDTLIWFTLDSLSVYRCERINDGISDKIKVKELLEKRQSRIEVSRSSEVTLKQEYSYKTAYWGDARRIVARLYAFYNTPPLNGTNWDARTTAQRRYLGVWIQENANAVGINHFGCSVSCYDGTTINLPAASWQYNNSSDIQRNIVNTGSSTPRPYPWSSCLINHMGLRNPTWIYVNNNQMFN